LGRGLLTNRLERKEERTLLKIPVSFYFAGPVLSERVVQLQQKPVKHMPSFLRSIHWKN
jgi:hypothetical protein